MSIPQPQMLYTGMNVAVPDWKSFNRDFNARMDMIRREKQQQKQFEIQRQDQLNREFLKTVDIDQINFAHGNFQQASADIYSAFDDSISAMVEDKKGQLTTQDIIKAKSLASRAEQELIKYKNWENNWMKDMQVIQDPRVSGNFSEESKRAVVSYDGSTPYSESRLKLDYWSPEKTADKLRAEFKDGNKASAILKAAGLGDVEGNNEQEWNVSYLQKFYNLGRDEKGNQYLELNKKAAIDAVKTRVLGQDYKLGLIGLMNSFDKIPDREKELYKQSAINSTGNEEDAMYAWFVDKYASDLFAQDRKMLQEKEPATTKFYYSFGGDKTTVNLEDPDTLTYGGETFDNVYQLGSKDIKMKEGFTIKDAREEVGDSLKDVGDKRYNNAVVVGVNVVNGKATDVIFSVPSDKYAKNEKGEDVYQIGSGYKAVKGTLDELVVLLNSDMETVKRLAVRSKSEGDKTIVVAPAEGNTEALKGYVINGNAITPSKKQKVESFDEATEAKIQSFMSKNKIKDKNEAIKILKENKII